MAPNKVLNSILKSMITRAIIVILTHVNMDAKNVQHKIFSLYD